MLHSTKSTNVSEKYYSSVIDEMASRAGIGRFEDPCLKIRIRKIKALQEKRNPEVRMTQSHRENIDNEIDSSKRKSAVKLPPGIKYRNKAKMLVHATRSQEKQTHVQYPQNGGLFCPSTNECLNCIAVTQSAISNENKLF